MEASFNALVCRLQRKLSAFYIIRREVRNDQGKNGAYYSPGHSSEAFSFTSCSTLRRSALCEPRTGNYYVFVCMAFFYPTVCKASLRTLKSAVLV